MNTTKTQSFNKELITLAIPLSLLGCFVFSRPPMLVYVVMCLDEIVKVPFIRRRYQKYIWLQNLTRS